MFCANEFTTKAHEVKVVKKIENLGLGNLTSSGFCS